MSSLKRVSKYLIPAFLIVILAVSVGAYTTYSIESQPKANPNNVYVGVAFGGNTTLEAKILIDKVKGYTNLFILDSGRNAITQNETAVNEICDYAVANGLSVIINVGIQQPFDTSRYWFWNQSLNVTQQWKTKWGNKFLGMYYNDEPGGIQLDGNWSYWFSHWQPQFLSSNFTTGNYTKTEAYQRYIKPIYDLNQIYYKMLGFMNNKTSPPNYDLEANFFTQDILEGDNGLSLLKNATVTTFTSDYALYWYDYLGGYNVMFAELGWNCSVAEQIALVKGAARMQGKEWGAMITWKYDDEPYYLDSGSQIYDQMLTSYEAGAKYIAVFNYPYDNGSIYGALTNDQLIAMQSFWNDIHQKQFPDLSGPDAVLVLPENYGWGMRNPNDTIWGFWLTDGKTMQIAIGTSALLSQYRVSLDIVYADPQYPVTNVGYQHVYYWNQTGI
ncbi:MAG: hypothetical protein ABSF44_05375 [Candidatus Bathyarchaeia archaeon]|jgi:hypothetical protein